jgi:hypothetical protein
MELEVGERSFVLFGVRDTPPESDHPLAVHVMLPSERGRPALRSEGLAVGRRTCPVIGDEADQVVLWVEGEQSGDGLVAVGEVATDVQCVDGRPGCGSVDDRTGAITTRSLNTVTVSPRSSSVPAALRTGIRESSFTRIVTVVLVNTCRTVTGSPDLVASMRKLRWGADP